jgi:hypothetical protein
MAVGRTPGCYWPTDKEPPCLLCKIQKITMRQARIRESSGLRKIIFQINHALLQGPPSPSPRTTHAPPHSLIIEWKSPGSSLPID